MTRLVRYAGWAAVAVLTVAAIVCAGCGGDGVTPAANTGSITGVIAHAGTGQGLGGITVSAGGVTTTTNADGQFTLSNVPAGNQVLTITIPPDRDLVLPPYGDIVVNVRQGQNANLPLPILVIDGIETPPNPPTYSS